MGLTEWIKSKLTTLQEEKRQNQQWSYLNGQLIYHVTMYTLFCTGKEFADIRCNFICLSITVFDCCRHIFDPSCNVGYISSRKGGQRS